MGWRNTAITTEKNEVFRKSHLVSAYILYRFLLESLPRYCQIQAEHQNSVCTPMLLVCLLLYSNFSGPRPRLWGNPGSLSFLSLHIISSKFGISSCYSSHFFLSLLLSKDKLWKIPEINNEKNPLLWILHSSGEQSHLMIKVCIRHFFVLILACWANLLFLLFTHATFSVDRGSWIVNNCLLWILCNYLLEFLIDLAS